MLAIPFPAIDPVAIALGPVSIRWYAIAYIAGIILGWWQMLRLADRSPHGITRKDVDDFVMWAIIGIIVGGRLGYVLFYRPGYYIEHPLEAIALWKGGMSFHGGLIGTILALVLFARKRGRPVLAFGDLVSAVVPIGLFFGRIANFVNGELYGRASDVPWAVIFPDGGPLPRHPSQIYEAILEGVVLFAILAILIRRGHALDRPGTVSGSFLIGYGLARFGVEFLRQPDAHLGFLFAGATMGQILSLPLILAGAWVLYQARPLSTRERR
ncbi:MAG: prolipoprotein diacylglyceryl transferase [Alphaproteobacteria bacterium]